MTQNEVGLRIALITSLLGGGGAERIVLTMAEWWVRRGHHVCVFVLRRDIPGAEYPIPDGVEVERLRLIDVSNRFVGADHLGRLWKLRRAVMAYGPTVVVPFLDKLNVAVLLALVGTTLPVIATEHLAPWRNPLGWGWETLRRLAYPLAATVVSPTERITTWFREHLRGRYLTLPYPAKVDLGGATMGRRRSVVLAAGRLTPQKGFDILLQAMRPILAERPDWHLQIAGEGEDEAELEQQIAAAGLDRRVTMLGAVGDLPERFKQEAVFVLPSRHEAYPMVLCEALAAGCAVVATDCPTGPREILGEPAAGLLVPPENVVALQQALQQVMGNVELRGQLSQRGMARAAHLTADAVMPAWDALVAAVAKT